MFEAEGKIDEAELNYSRLKQLDDNFSGIFTAFISIFLFMKTCSFYALT